MNKYIVLIVISFLSIALWGSTIAGQGFDNTANDTWAYTASPASTVPYFWGRTNQNLGGATAQSGSWYWGSWLMEAGAASLTFTNVSITPGTQHSLNFWYYSKNLILGTDQLQLCMEYDNGTQWDNCYALLLNTQAWTLFSINIPQTANTVRIKIMANYSNPNMDKYVHWDSFSIKDEAAEFTAPVVFNTSISQRIDGSKIVDVYYNLFDANGDACEISIKLSTDGGNTFTVSPNPALLSGDIGEDIAPGFGKHVVWDAGMEAQSFDGNQFMVKFTAEDGQFPVPEGFVYVPAGTFTIGDTIGGGGSYELPTHTVTLNSFYIAKFEVTQGEYQAIMGNNPSAWGMGTSYPVNNVHWYSAVKYCNLKSIADGLTPVYTISGSTNPASWGPVPNGYSYNVTWDAAICNWSANGYRLPTEAEWEYAGRGATNTPDYLYSGSGDINAVAWYGNNSPSGCQPVGTKAPNSLGIYDMSGNLWEWCWDWYGSYTSISQDNPAGASSGYYRVIRGGAWFEDAMSCRVAARGGDHPFQPSYGAYGLRLVRSRLVSCQD